MDAWAKIPMVIKIGWPLLIVLMGALWGINAFDNQRKP